MDAETLQLLYQIALMGHRDLQIAPNPRTGFEMTLLRMHAFAPETAAPEPTPAPDKRGRRSVTDTAPTQAAPERAAPRQAAAEQPAQVQVAPATVEPRRQLPSDPWSDLLADLELVGMARALAERCVLTRHEGAQWVLCVDAAYDTLLNDRQVTVIQDAIEKAIGGDVQLEVTVGEPEWETPAERSERLVAERLADARHSLESDATVQSLLTDFGGDLVSVRPLDGPGNETERHP